MSTGTGETQVVQVISDHDIVSARNAAREVAAQLNFSSAELTLIATSISEIARNIAVYASPGRVSYDVVRRDGRRGIRMVASDNGPGIPDLDLALTDGWSSVRSLGIGLPGARRLMDEFDIDSIPGTGTTVTMIKWER
jgi:serine/threonine-protein kinase RsbT